jgi:hypothetical protein
MSITAGQFAIRLCWTLFLIAVLAHLYGLTRQIKLLDLDVDNPYKLQRDISALKLIAYSGLSSAFALGVFTMKMFCK